MKRQAAPKRNAIAKSRRKPKADYDKLEDVELESLAKHLKDQQVNKSAQKIDPYAKKRRALYDVARTNAKNMTNEAISFLEEIQESITELRSQETNFDKYLEDAKLVIATEEAAQEEINVCDPTTCTSLANQMRELVDAQRSQRRDILNDFSREARRRLYSVLQEQQQVADASILIKHYKSLLHTRP